MTRRDVGRWHRAKEPARWLRRRSVSVDRAATIVETARQLATQDPVLIYSIGKVGTTALTASIEAATGRPVVKAHGLTREGIRVRLERELQITPRPRGIWANQWLRQDLRLRRWHPWDVITGVRDPIAIAASAHFYSLRVRNAANLAVPVNHDLAVHVRAVAEILERLIQEDWFREELQPVTGIDVYASPFPADIGHREFVKGRFRVLLIRQEDIRRTGGVALGAFLGLEGPCTILDRNTGAGDPLYERFRADARLPQELVTRTYETALARHFYRSDEREAMRRRWSS